ncbi:MAG: hypothetical protein FWB86_09075 [Treponema sp.]|nr:hypothetical protein [Treponema sp.]
MINKKNQDSEMKTIPAEVAALIPEDQLRITITNLPVYQDGIENLKNWLQKCPELYKTDGMEEHPAVFHYFFGSTDIYICEYDGKDRMFGYAVLGGDLNNSEWRYFNLSELTSIRQLNIDYHFMEQSVEEALYNAYPNHFKKPKSAGNKPS